MAVIVVPKPPKKAFNPRRPAGLLLQAQLRHLEWAVRPAAERKPGEFRPKPARTEAEAAARIEALTRELHRQATAPRPAAKPAARAASKARRTGSKSAKKTPSKKTRTKAKPRRRRSR